ncbi:small integral membrane protein 14 isoform X1 [Prinia subflava]|uniref:small integral membrane protein 14 isoform X1 n=1 Tax=Prinia subflava TaxID=208062 RepID=UPI002FE4272A
MAPARPCTRSGPSPEAPGRRTVKEHPWEGSGSAVAGEMSEVSLRKQLAQGAAESSQKEAKLPIFRFCSGCSGKHDLYQVSKSFVFLLEKSKMTVLIFSLCCWRITYWRGKLSQEVSMSGCVARCESALSWVERGSLPCSVRRIPLLGSFPCLTNSSRKVQKGIGAA